MFEPVGHVPAPARTEEEERLWQELRASEARFRTIYENAPFMIDSFDENGQATLWNRACTEQLGYTRDEVNAFADPLGVFYPDPEVRRQVGEVVGNPDGLFREYKVRHKDGRDMFQMWANFRLPDRSLIAVGYDVTALREAREQLEQKVEERTRELDQQRARTAASAKLAALGEMAGGIAHEINNPLAVIAGLAEQLQQLEPAGPKGELRREMLADIRSAVHRITRIVAGMRAISRDASHDPKVECALRGVLQDTLGICRERFQKNGVTLEEEIAGPELRVLCRPVEISQVLLNLLNNAFDAVQGGTLRRVSVAIEAVGAEVLLRVRDSGPGVPVELREKIFQPFFTTKPVGQGTGIGLSISRGIAEAHGGSLRYEREGVLTCFTLALPRLFP